MFPRIFFAPDGAEGGAPATTTPAATTTATTPVTPAATDPAPEAPTLTNKQANDLIAKEAAKRTEKATADLLAKMGFKSLDEVEAFNKARADKMSEEEKLREAAKKAEEARIKSDNEAESARYEAAAARLGVPDDKIETYVRYAKVSDGETPTEKMKNYLDSIGFKKPTAGAPFGGGTTSQSVDPKTALKNVIKDAMK